MSSTKKKKQDKPLLPTNPLEGVEGELAVMPPLQDPYILVRVMRDTEGRIVLEQEGKPRRIAGTDDAFVEVARQFASDLVKERQI